MKVKKFFIYFLVCSFILSGAISTTKVDQAKALSLPSQPVSTNNAISQPVNLVGDDEHINWNGFTSEQSCNPANPCLGNAASAEKYPPYGEYLLFWQSSIEQPSSCGVPPASAPQDIATLNHPPRALWETLLSLQASGKLEILELLPDQSALRLTAQDKAAAYLKNQPETQRLELIQAISQKPQLPPLSSQHKKTERAKVDLIIPPSEAELSPAISEDSILVYEWVNNQGATPPVTYNWVEISGTGTIAATGDDNYVEIPIGFPFSFYGNVYTSTFVAANGFISFGSGNYYWSNTSIPNTNNPNNAIYGFWDDLSPVGGSDGNVYTKQVDASTFIIEWYGVWNWNIFDYVTFQIILNGVDNTILLQYKTIPDSSSTTVGVENHNGTLATQYAYNTSGAIFNGLAIKFTPTLTSSYTIQGTVRDKSGVPIPEAFVETLSGPSYSSDYTAANGTYTLTVISGAYTVEASKSGFSTAPVQTISLPPNRTGVDFVLTGRYTIQGVVYDFDGSPMSDVQVQTSAGDPMYASDYTNTAGEYALTVITGTYTIKVNKSDFPEPPTQTVSVPPSRTGVNFTFPERLVIRGTVRDHDGTPIQYATVETSYSDPAYVYVSTDSSGAYELNVITGTYTVEARKSGYISPPTQLVSVPPSQSGVDFTFPELFSIAGIIHDFDGTPLSGVSVSTSYNDPVHTSDYTGSDGIYELKVISGTYEISVSKYGYPNPPHQHVSVPPSQSGIDFTFPERYTITGTVRTFEGTPMASVHVSTVGSPPMSTSDYTDNQGEYLLNIISGTYTLEASLSGYQNPPNQVVSVPPSQTNVDFTFPQFFTVTGTVRDYDGSPLSSVYVKSSPFEVGDYTDSEGHYTLHLPPGLYCLSVSHNSYPEPLPQPLLVPDQSVVDFVFPKRFSIQGTVRDFTGAPLSDVQVVTDWSDPYYSYDYTAADGAYSLTVITGTYHLEASIYGRADRLYRTVNTPPDQTGVDFNFPQVYSISGTTYDPFDAALSGASVYVCPLTGGNCAYDYTGSDGHYQIFASAGAWSVEGYKSGYLNPPEKEVTVPPDQDGVDLHFSGGTTGYTISGTVRDPLNHPLSDIDVFARTSCWNYGKATTTISGQYTITVPGPEIYLVETGDQRRLVSVPPSATGVDFIHPAFSSISGKVREADGQPVESILVEAVSGRWKYSDYTDEEGYYQISMLPGTYHVDVSRTGYLPLPAQEVTVPPGVSNVDFTYPVVYRILGLVQDNRGKPVSYAEVVATGANGSAYVSSWACGAYQFFLPSGTYDITASHSNYTSPPKQTVTVPPKVTWLNFTLGDLATISGVVRDHLSNPVAGASVWASGANDYADTETGANGSYSLQVQPGTYSVSASKPGYPPLPAQSVSVPPSRSNIDFSFPAIYTIRGTVRDGGNQPLPGSIVYGENVVCELSGGNATVDSSGVYTLTLGAGTYNIFAQKDQYASNSIQKLTVPPGADSVNFTVLLPTRYPVSGIVRDNLGNPMAGVQVYGYACGKPGNSTKTGENGSYTLWLASGTFTINAYLHDYDSSHVHLSVSGPVSGVDLTLTPSATAPTQYVIYGYVTDATGGPIYDAYVYTSNGPDWDSDYTGSCGLYRLVLYEAGNYTIQVSRDGYALSNPITISVPPNHADVDFVLSPLTGPKPTISGTVLDQGGAPVPGANIRFWFCTASTCSSRQSTLTDNQGYYSASVSPGDYTVEAFKGCYFSDEKEASVPPNAVVNLTLQHKTNRISGRVSDNKGSPLFGIWIYGQKGNLYTSGSTNSNGDYSLQVSPGKWLVSPYSQGCPFINPSGIQVTVPPDQTGKNFILPVAEYTITGTITTAGGAPLASVYIIAEASGIGNVTAYSDVDGRYVLYVSSGTWTLTPYRYPYKASPLTRTVSVPPNRTGIDFLMQIIRELFIPVIRKSP